MWVGRYFFLVRYCFQVIFKCLKGHKSLGSLCSVVKTLIVSGVRGTKGQGHLLSCSGQLKTKHIVRIFFITRLFEAYFCFFEV